MKTILYHCMICRRFNGRSYLPQPPPPLPDFRVQESQPFSYTGVDFTGPLYVKGNEGNGKVWVCLFTCCSTRALHLEVVPDLTTEAFMRCFRRFTTRKGKPCKIISDNAKTFMSAKKVITGILSDSTAKGFHERFHSQWQFNLERAP